MDECLTIKLNDCFEVANEFHLISIEQSSVLTHDGALRDFRLSRSSVRLTTKSASDEISCKMEISLLRQPRCESTEQRPEFVLRKGESIDQVAGSDASDDKGCLLNELDSGGVWEGR